MFTFLKTFDNYFDCVTCNMFSLVKYLPTQRVMYFVTIKTGRKDKNAFTLNYSVMIL